MSLSCLAPTTVFVCRNALHLAWPNLNTRTRQNLPSTGPVSGHGLRCSCQLCCCRESRAKSKFLSFDAVKPCSHSFDVRSPVTKIWLTSWLQVDSCAVRREQGGFFSRADVAADALVPTACGQIQLQSSARHGEVA